MYKICITGAAGSISNNLIPLIVEGTAFPGKKIALSLLDISSQVQALKAIQMELTDCDYPNLESVSFSDSPKEAFKDADIVIFLGGYPRKPGMERVDLLKINGKIFLEQAEALASAKPNVKCVVVANPCNTNAKILYEGIKKNKINIPKENITCLTRLDQNRANGLWKEKKEKPAHWYVWGNHSGTSVLDNNEGIEAGEDFEKKIHSRGAEIIKTKGGSSSLGAAKAIVDHLKDWCNGSKKVVSMGIISEGDYDIRKELMCSFPLKCNGDWKYEVVKELNLSEKTKAKIAATVKELIEEEKEIPEI